MTWTKKKELRKISFDSGLSKQTHNILETDFKILIEFTLYRGKDRADAFKYLVQSTFMYLIGKKKNLKTKANVYQA